MLLFAVMACSILIRFLEDRSVDSMNKSFISMYNDRLIPAADLFYIAENANAKKLCLEDALYGRPGQQIEKGNLEVVVRQFNKRMDSLISKYQKTYLVGAEKTGLAALNAMLFRSRQLEKQVLELILTGNQAAAQSYYEHRYMAVAELAVQQLSDLMAIQKQIGEELIKDSEFMVSGSKLYSALQIALAIVIGMLIVGLVFSSNMVKISNDKFHLN